MRRFILIAFVFATGCSLGFVARGSQKPQPTPTSPDQFSGPVTVSRPYRADKSPSDYERHFQPYGCQIGGARHSYSQPPTDPAAAFVISLDGGRVKVFATLVPND